MHRPLVAVVVTTLSLTFATSAAASNDPFSSKQWGLAAIGAERAWATATGAGVVVAVLDSGVDLAHEDLAGRLVPGRDFVDGDDQPQDANGHGTHVAGIVAAAANNRRGVAGVAPGAKVMPVRVLDAGGAGRTEDVVAGIRWAVSHGAKVLNLSLSEDTQAILGSSLTDAVREAWAAGVVPVVSAGNQFVLGSGFSDEPALVVTATDRGNGSPSYSSGVGAAQWGIAAPGGETPDLGVEGAIVSSYWEKDKVSQYAYLAGTSQAAPHVAGAVAVLLSTGRFTPQQAVDRLLATARDLGEPGRDTLFGAGLVDLAAAVGQPPTPVTSAPPPPTRPTAAPATAPSPGVTGAGADAGAGEATTTTTTAASTTSVTNVDRPGDDDPEAVVVVGPPLEPGEGDTTLPAVAAGVLAATVAAAAEWTRRQSLAIASE